MLERASFLAQQGVPPPATITPLTSPGGPVARTSYLRSSGWNGNSFVASPVLRCDPSGAISGTFWHVEGKPAVTWIAASAIWPGVPSLQDINLGLQPPSLNIFTFPDASCVSSWVSSNSLGPETRWVAKRAPGDPATSPKVLSPSEASEAGITSFQIRLHLFIDHRDSAQVFYSIYPTPFDQLPERLQELVEKATFPVLTTQVREQADTGPPVFGRAHLRPPADRSHSIPLAVLGFIDTTMVPEALRLTLETDPTTFVACIRYRPRNHTDHTLTFSPAASSPRESSPTPLSPTT